MVVEEIFHGMRNLPMRADFLSFSNINLPTRMLSSGNKRERPSCDQQQREKRDEGMMRRERERGKMRLRKLFKCNFFKVVRSI